ncbi:MAG TPA: RagB/SusD family nutrient uptake outer membrane protein [Thermomicrobiales bacterium]|nr:RagB/SusD family nutrient uptake outer membrane protein [Thermomicrobiales bacterium]
MRYARSTFVAVMLAGLQLTAGGCEGFLEPNPASFTTTENYYRTPEHFEAAVNGAYSRLRAFAGVSNAAFRVNTELRFDCCITDPHRLSTSPSGKPIAEWYATATNDFFANLWSGAYHAIAQTNIILGRIGSIEFRDETQRDRIVGQAKFIRALAYWYLVQFFGEVPLVLTEVRTLGEAIPDGRRPVAEVYAQIIDDLMDAAEKLPVSWAAAERGRATRGAARFLLGRTYLLTQDYENARAALEDVVGAGGASPYGYQLMPNYRDVFNPSNINSAESIFELQFGAGVAGQPNMGLIGSLLPEQSRGKILPNAVGTNGDQLVSMQLVEQYEEGDQRLEASIFFWFDEAADSTKAILWKFIWPQHINAQGQQAGNSILFRYADAILSLAEAHWRLGNSEQAINYVNLIRERAGLLPVDVASVRSNPLVAGTYLESDHVGRAIFNERTIELAGEGHRMFDLIRFGVAYEVMVNWSQRTLATNPELGGSFHIEPWKILLPIPAREIEASKGALTQNPGW